MFKKLSLTFLISILLGVSTVSAATVFNSNQVGTSPVNGYILQTNGTVSSWVPNSGGAGGTGTATSSFTATYPVKVITSTSAINYSLLNMGTTTATCAGTVSCSQFVIIGTSPITITGSAGTSASSTLLTDNNTFGGNDTFSNAITGSVTGNAGTATKLATARAINNVNFDGTAAITINAASSTLLTDNNRFAASTTLAGQTNMQGASSTIISAATLCLGSDICRTTWPSVAGAASSTLLTDNNTFSGLNKFSNTGTTTHSGGIETTNLGTQFIWATSTIATSTFAGAVQIGATAGDHAFTLTAGRDYPASISTGGAVNINGTLNAGPAWESYTNHGSGATGRANVINCDNTAFDQTCLYVRSQSQSTTAMNIEGVTNGQGTLKLDVGSGGNTGNNSGALLSGDATDHTSYVQGIFFKCNTSTSTPCLYLVTGVSATLFKIDGNGNATTTGYVEVNGTGTSTFAGAIQLAKPLNVTSSTASSTFANGLNISAGCFSVNGTCITSGSGGTASSTLLIDHNTFSASTTLAAQLNMQGASSTVFSAGTICLGADICRATWPTVAGAASSTLYVDNGTFAASTTFAAQLNLQNASSTSQTIGKVFTGAVNSTGNLILTSGSGNTISLSASNSLGWNGTQFFPGTDGSASLGIVNHRWGLLYSLGASTTVSSNFATAYFGGTATTTIDSAGNIVIPSGSKLTNTGVTNGCATWASSVLGTTGSACGSGGSSASSTLLIDNNTFSGLSNFSNFTLMGTSTKALGELTVGSSTAPQVALSDNVAADNLWTMRNAGGNFFLSTSTALATSSNPVFSIYTGGSVVLPEYNPATSTSMTINWLSGNTQKIIYGTSAMTISFSNVTENGRLTLETCTNGGGTGGAITFTGGHYSGGVQPGNTTTANQCDLWFWEGMKGTTTTAYPTLTGMTSGIQ